MFLLVTYFALVCGGTVEEVIVASQEVVDSRPRAGCKWVETAPDGSKGKNYAGKGYKYDDTMKAFISQRPYASWTLNRQTAKWDPPVPYPKDGKEHGWDESSKTWKEVKK